MIIGLHILYMELKLLHRDISVGNLAYEEVNGEPVIIILDFELASYANSSEHENEVRTGTAPYMSREALDGFTEMYKHGLPHDLESVYYVFTTLSAGYRGTIPKGDPLKRWRKGNYASMRNAKNEHMRLRDSPFVVDYKGKVAIPIEDRKTASRLENIRLQYKERIGTIITEETKMEKRIIEDLEQQAILEGKTDAEVLLLTLAKRREFAAAPPPQRPTNTISFKIWAKGARLTVYEEHLKCDCCEKD